MIRVVVIGGGIAGLTAAWSVATQRPDVEVLLLEAATVVGGKLQDAIVGGIRVDVGAEALLARRPEGVDLIGELGLREQMIAPLSTAALVRTGGALHQLPLKTMFGIPTDVDAVRACGVLSERALNRIAAEPDAEPLPALTEDIAVGALVRSRLGNEVTDRLVEPLLGGVYAGQSDALSLRATMPALAERLAGGGSLVQAASAVVTEASRTPSSAAGPVFTSLASGLAQLPRELASSGRFRVRTGATVRRVTPHAAVTPGSRGGFELICGPVPEPERIFADAVIVATPATKARRLLSEVAPAAAAELSEISYASVAIASLAFRGIELPAGSGALIALREGLAVKAVTISSQKWPIRSDGIILLRASLGRVGEEWLLQRSDEELLGIVRQDLARLFGVTAAPIDAVLTRWGGGLPQYAVGHVERVARIRASVAKAPALAVCGAAYDGLGIPACIGSARVAAGQVLASLSAGGQ